MNEYLFLTLRCRILEYGPCAFAYFMGFMSGSYLMGDAIERDAYMAAAIGLASR